MTFRILLRTLSMKKIELYSHQKLAIEKLKTGSILVGGVGSGKSLTALAYYFVKVCHGEFLEKYSKPKDPKDLYIITTARKRDTHEWENELIPFMLSTDIDISICGIKVIIDSWNNIEKYSSVKNSFFIFDEQRVVGYGAWTKNFLKITKSNDWILLSATPGDTWMDYVPVFVANGYFKNKTDFCRKHVIYKPFMNYPVIDRYVNIYILEKMRSKILVEMKFDRETVRHIIDICPNYDKELFNETLKNRWNYWNKEPIKNSSEFISCLRKSVNISEDRITKTLELIKKQHGSLIFYNFDYELELLREMCNRNKITYSEWNGHKHQPIPDNRNKCWCYLVQYSAGAEGWNCTITDTIIFYSLNHSYKITEQAMGRIDRMNTPFKDLYFYRMISKSWIDRTIAKCIEQKKDFNERRFNDELETIQ